MTERKKLSLTKPAASDDSSSNERGPRRAPVRGSGSAPRARQTAEQAAKAREERAARGPYRDHGAGDERRPPRQDRDDQDRYRDERRPARRDERMGDRADARPRRDSQQDPRNRDSRFDPRDPHSESRNAPRRTSDEQALGSERGYERGPARGPARKSTAPGSEAYGQRDGFRDGVRDGRREHGRESNRDSFRDGAPHRHPDRERTPRQRDVHEQRGHRAPAEHQEARAYQPKPPAVSSHDDGKMRLSKLMSERGMASRREADEWIEQGWVRVNGEVVEELGTRVFPDVVITVDPLARTQQAQRVTILLNKPIGYVSGQAEDGYEPAVVLIKPENRWSADRVSTQLTRGHLRNLAPAGRLDIDSTGLLVLTQDGRVAKTLIGEDSGVEKEYLVRVQAMAQPDAADVSKVVPPEDMEKLRFGLELDGRQLKPAKVSWQNEHQLRFVLREGRKRQIRRMCELVGLKVVGLKRVRMGRIALGDLPVGQWRFLRPDEQF